MRGFHPKAHAVRQNEWRLLVFRSNHRQTGSKPDFGLFGVLATTRELREFGERSDHRCYISTGNRSMKTRTKTLFICSLPFLIFFAFGVTNFGQRLLIGKLPADIDHWKADDIYMGAGLAPWVYGLVPFILLCFGGLLSLLLERHRRSKPPV